MKTIFKAMALCGIVLAATFAPKASAQCTSEKFLCDPVYN